MQGGSKPRDLALAVVDLLFKTAERKKAWVRVDIRVG